ncbi:MAG: hypothetical protein D6706_10635 [Chloroflexi bacterium]|nr:MAG: hypothetical protein D6706_10635 [Chloroflexota bacterium]
MTKTAQNFTMWSGDSKLIQVMVTDSAGNSVALAGATIEYVIKDSVNGTTRVSKSTSNGITISGNTFTITLDPADTAGLSGQYYHEAQITDVAGNVSTALVGNIVINEDAIV